VGRLKGLYLVSGLAGGGGASPKLRALRAGRPLEAGEQRAGCIFAGRAEISNENRGRPSGVNRAPSIRLASLGELHWQARLASSTGRPPVRPQLGGVVAGSGTRRALGRLTSRPGRAEALGGSQRLTVARAPAGKPRWLPHTRAAGQTADGRFVSGA